MPDVCLSFVLLFTIFIIVVTQKLVLQRSKNVTAKCTENLSPPLCILFSLEKTKDCDKLTNRTQTPTIYTITLTILTIHTQIKQSKQTKPNIPQSPSKHKLKENT